MIRNSSTEYGAFSKVMHWLMAGIILPLIMVGIYMADLPMVTDAEKQFALMLYGAHKSFGVVMLLLVAIRLVWMTLNSTPPLPAVFDEIERKLVEGLKRLLYLMMIIMPVSGYLMSSAHGHPIELFGLFKLPALIGKNESVFGFLHGMHMIIGWLMLMAVMAHVAGALKHRFLETVSGKDILQRML